MNALHDILRAEIQSRGPITCARFMELALYHPALGYYERSTEQVGRDGDFITSVSAGSLFGELLAARFTEWRHSLKSPQGAWRAEEVFHIIEAGAHDAALALDILAGLSRSRAEGRGEAAIQYTILEPSSRRRDIQQTRLKHIQPPVHWVTDLGALDHRGVDGVLFSNELLDAFPVHRIAWSAHGQCWFEWMVDARGGHFVWSQSSDPLPGHLAALIPSTLAEAARLNQLPDGYTCEVCPAAVNWWRNACSAIGNGWLLAIDYGTDDAGHLIPHRAEGTLRGYRHQRACSDVLATPGLTDITSHVNFSAIRHAGETCGMTTVFWGTQEKFLVDCLRCWMSHNDTLTPSQAAQFRQLTHPEAMGRKFSVLVQRRPAPLTNLLPPAAVGF